MIQTLSWSLSALSDVFILMILIFSIFSILGCFFYDSFTYEDYKDTFVYINEYYIWIISTKHFYLLLDVQLEKIGII